jgi:cytochrome c oxidase subunit 2
MRFLLVFVLSLIGFGTTPSFAEPQPWGLSFQPPLSPVAHRIHDFHGAITYLIFAIAIFVLLLLLYVVFRFRASKNPVPSKTSHNTLLEVIWTGIPVLILVAILVPSMRLLYFTDVAPDAAFTVKVTGHQWYWQYDYPDHGGFTFDSYMIEEKNLKPGQKRLLDVDNPLVLPVGTKIKFILTSADVIHSWAMPSLAVKTDTVPGRLNETWTLIEKEGMYYGQCSEICGVGHAFMPIVIKAVSPAAFDAWIKEKGGKVTEKLSSKPL